VDDAVTAFGRGDLVMVMDSDDREDECDLVCAAETVTAEQMAFIIRHTTGIVCVAVEKDRLEHFGLHPATGRNTDANATNFYVSTDFLPDTSTGVSAADRAATARALCNLTNKAESFSKPGHMFPLCARPGGVLERPGHTESTYDLCRLSGAARVGILAEMMHDDGTMYRRDDSLEFARKHGIPIITVPQLAERMRRGPAAASLEDSFAAKGVAATEAAEATALEEAGAIPLGPVPSSSSRVGTPSRATAPRARL